MNNPIGLVLCPAFAGPKAGEKIAEMRNGLTGKWGKKRPADGSSHSRKMFFRARGPFSFFLSEERYFFDFWLGNL